ncbi:MAG: sigma-70 family RNA polymerase sigma factor [Bacilli bacterium]|nr:sigma-70 family RNA polymerase sigma factor [Bacilli bacterium]MDD4407952.1 sigma-70 family RNA polymerase sigma factor [Bacilli bacterium]
MTEQNLIEQYELYIYKIAKKFYNVETADLFQAGCIGLIKAYRKYKLEEGVNFMTFAYKYIFGEMYDLASKSRDIKLNKYYLKILKELEVARSELIQKLNKNPTLTEICLYTEIDESLATDVIMLTSQIISLDDEYKTINGELYIKDCIGTENNLDDQILINDSIETLNPLEKTIIDYRYFQDLTQTETANILGISQVKVSRIETKSKQKIKEYIAA